MDVMTEKPMARSILASLLVLLVGCVDEAGDRADPSAGQSSAEVRSEEEIVALGNEVSAALIGELMGRVAAAIEEGGPAHAIDFCSTEALPRTAAVADAHGVELKRTSTRLRNPANAPDAYERAALEHFEAEIEAGRAPPPYLVQRADGELRYYRPIIVAEPCTVCHGPRDALDPAVVEALDRRYPDDDATGYRPGDFRGLVRVSVPAAPDR